MQSSPYYLTQLVYPPDIVDIVLPNDDIENVRLAPLPPLPTSARSFSTNRVDVELPDGYITENIEVLSLLSYGYPIHNLIRPSLDELVVEDYDEDTFTIPDGIGHITLYSVHTNVVIESEHVISLTSIDVSNIDFRCSSYIDRLKCGSITHIQPNRVRELDLLSCNKWEDWIPSADDHTLEYLRIPSCDSVVNITGKLKSLKRLRLINIPSDINEIDPSVEVTIYGSCNIDALVNGHVNRVLHIDNARLMSDIIYDPGRLIILGSHRPDNSYVFEIIHEDYIPNRAKSARS